MRRKSVVWEWLYRSVHRGVGLGDLAGSIGGNAVTAWVHLAPAWQGSLKDLIWQVPVFGLAGGMLWRLAVTPVEMIKEARGRADAAERRVNELTGGGPIRDRTDVGSAAVYMIFGEWNRSMDELTPMDQITFVHSKFKMMVQDASDGHLVIWVRWQRYGGSHVDPGAEYWGNHILDWGDGGRTLMAKANLGVSHLSEAYDPLVRKSDIERLYGP